MSARHVSGLRVLYAVPDLLTATGGIARHGQLVGHLLTAIADRTAIVVLNDATGTVKPRSLLGACYVACGGRKHVFSLRVLTALGRRPNVVLLGHANFSLLGWVTARLTGARLVVFLHGVEVWAPLPRLRRFGLRRADLWIAVSACTADRAAAANGLPRDRIAVLHHCLADPVGSDKPRAGAALSLLTVGRISAAEGYKGHDRVIRAMPALLRSFPDLIYHVVGDGDGRSALESLALEEGVEGAVRFHGVVSVDELNRIYSEASVFVMPSTGEGFGFVFLEAMGHGLAVVAGNGDATPEVVVDGETGFLVGPESVDGIVDAVETLLSDPALRARMGQAGRERVAREFSCEEFSRRLVTVLGFSPSGDGRVR